MDNKQEIEMIRCLIAKYSGYLDDKTVGYNNHELCKALMKAIKSLEAWDKVKEDINKLTVYHTTAQGSELLSKNAVIRLMNKYFGGE